MKTIKRSLSLLLVFCMMLAFVPAAMAADTLTDATIQGSITSAKVGDTITAVAIFDTGSETVDYAWSDGTNNALASTAAYTAQAADLGKTLTCKITSKADSSRTFTTTGVIISAATLGSVTVTKASSLVYTSNAQNLIEGESYDSGATIKYYKDSAHLEQYGDGTTPQETNAGTYTVYYEVTKLGYTAVSGSVLVTIAKKAVTITPTSGLSKVAGASDPTLTYSSSVSSLTFTGALSRDDGESVGTYDINIGTLSAGRNYELALSGAVNFTITSATSPFTSVTMSATATGATGAVSLSWSALPTSSTTTYYTVYYGTDSNTTTVYATNTTSTSATLTGLTNGTTYYFKVTATRSGYDTASSTVVYATPYIASNTTLEVRTGSSSSTAISSSGTYYLSKASSTGYTASSYAQQFRVYNTGSSQATGVTVTLASTSNFTISSSLSSSTISAGNYETFTIRPVSGLSKGTYSVKVTVSGNNVSTSRVFYVSFTVGTSSGDLYVNTSKTSTSSITKYTFTSKDEGYKALDETTFYVHNDSGSSITSVKVALSGTNKSSFTLDGTSLGTISDDDYETFTVVPKTGLSDGTYKATVTVTSNQGDDYEIALTFVVGDGSGGDNDEFYFTEKKNGSSFSKLTFETVTAGYSALSSQTVYLYNDSGSSLKSVTLSLSGTDKSSFTLGSTSLGTISDGSYATFTVVPKTGLAAGTYTAKVTAEASDGTTSSFTLSFTVKASSTTTTTTTTTTKYTDVTTSAWYYNDVAKASTVGLIDGFADGTFKPDNNLTIAQTIKLAACMHQLYYNGTVTLTNGSPNWYDSYVTYALNNGIISGIYADYLAVITREEFVNIMYNSHPSSDYAILNDLATDYIPDVKSGDTYYSKIFRFYQAGILTGSDNAGTFNPKSNIKRSEVAAILIRIYDKAERIG